MQNKTLELLYVSCWHFHEIFSKRINILNSEVVRKKKEEFAKILTFRSKQALLRCRTILYKYFDVRIHGKIYILLLLLSYYHNNNNNIVFGSILPM